MEQNNGKENGAVSSVMNNKNLWISALAVILVILVIALPKGQKGSEVSELTEGDTSTSLVEEVETTAQLPVAPGTQTRAEARVAYEGKKITVTGACDIAPETQTLPLRTIIMVDNDSDAAHTVTVGAKSYPIKSKYYRLSLIDTPGEIVVTCDGVEKATITVQ